MEESNKSPQLEGAKSVRKAVYNSILNYISENGIKPGDKLPPEHDLAEMLEVSRTSLREGIRMLEGAGFISTRHGGGMYVAEYDGSMLLDFIQYSIGYGQNDITDLYEIRKNLEINYIREACEKATPDQIRRLKALNEKMHASNLEDVNEQVEYHWLDMEFHMTLYENISNQLAVRIIQLYWDIMLTRHLPQRIGADMPSITVGNHRMLVRAMESGDPNFAQAAMRVNMFDSHIV